MNRLLLTPTELKHQVDVSELPDLVTRDYEEIDADLLGTQIFKRKHIARNTAIAPPQGNTFLNLVQPLENLLNKFNHRYR